VRPFDQCGWGQQAVSVGSLSHDACCRACAQGVACSDEGISAVSLETIDDSKPCALEWRKATWNFIDDRYWCTQKTAAVSDLSSFRTDAPRSYGVSNYWGSLIGVRSVPTLRATVKLCAPAGTKLDCLGCRGTTSRNRQGDAQFCCTGYFSKVESPWWAPGKVWGVCA
jgi:hypothetical protein